MVHVLQTMQNLVISRCCFTEDLFGDVAVAVAVAVAVVCCVRPLMTSLYRILRK